MLAPLDVCPLNPISVLSRKDISMFLRKFLAVLPFALLAFGATYSIAADRASDEKAIRDLDAAWVKAAQAKDADTATSFYADDASLLPPGSPIVTGKAHIRELWSKLMATPGYAISFTPTKIVVSKAGDMAYDIGTTSLTLNDDKGQPVTSVGKYVVAWEKRGGQWKTVADTFNDNK
jgi:uncharacterized protein (TIGR02246 family)